MPFQLTVLLHDAQTSFSIGALHADGTRGLHSVVPEMTAVPSRPDVLGRARNFAVGPEADSGLSAHALRRIRRFLCRCDALHDRIEYRVAARLGRMRCPCISLLLPRARIV